MATIRILPRGSQTRRRYIMSPRALATATIQRELNSDALPQLRLDATKYQFTEEIDARITSSMASGTELDVFRTCQAAFSSIIEKYQNESAAMLKIKQGYDSLVEKMLHEGHSDRQRKLIVHQSMTSFAGNLVVAQTKLEAKRRVFDSVAESCTALISDLRTEIAGLERRIWDTRLECQIEENTSGQNQLTIQQYEKKLAKTLKNHANWKAQKDEIDVELAAKQRRQVTSDVELGQVLDAVFARTRQINDTKEAIARIKRDIKEAKQALEQAKKRLEDRRPEKGKTADELAESHKTIDRLVTENDTMATTLRIGLASLGADDLFISAVDDDPIRQVALYISFLKGYERGIDPEMFPDLV
jgi:chromosome segregation ATPase